MEAIIKIVKSLEDSGLVKQFKIKVRNEKVNFLVGY